MTSNSGILERLAAGPVIGDGGFTRALHLRGYVKAGPYTPECVVEHPEAVKELHREFLLAGSDVMQAFTFYATDSKLGFRNDNNERGLPEGEAINVSACKIAREIANEGDALVSGSLSETPAYKENKGKKYVQEQFRKQLKYFMGCDIDFIICEYFGHIEEMEWAIEIAKKSNKPVAATMCIASISDRDGIPTGQCAVRMAKAGADIVGINCNFGPNTSLEGVKVMKKALEAENLHPYLMIQPIISHTPEINVKNGYVHLPESPFALEPRMATRFEIAQWARNCYDAGINYIGGCCGFEPYHIRAISEELWRERGKKCAITEKFGFVTDGLVGSTERDYTDRNTSHYWKSLRCATGRPYSNVYSEYEID